MTGRRHRLRFVRARRRARASAMNRLTRFRRGTLNANKDDLGSGDRMMVTAAACALLPHQGGRRSQAKERPQILSPEDPDWHDTQGKVPGTG